jgi:outer membrane immunogenic protein
MMRKLIFAIGALLAMAVPALAEEPTSNTLVPGPLLAAPTSVDALANPAAAQLAQVPMNPAVYNWTGCYIGGFGGYAGSARVHMLEPISSLPPTGGMYNPVGGLAMNYHTRENGFGGGTLGCNWQIAPGPYGSNFVVGIEGEGGYLSESGHVIDPNSILSNNGDTITRTRIGDAYGVIAARLGFAFDPLLLYFKAGISETTVRTTFTDSCFTGGCGALVIAGAGSTTRAGPAVGAGVEYAFTPRWSIKGEYLWLGVNGPNKVCGNGFVGATGALVGNFCSPAVGVDGVHTVKIGINYKFWSPPPPPPEMPPAPPPPPQRISFIVFFDWDKDVITREGMGVVQKAADAYRAGGMVQIQVTGYTDRSGSAGYNQRLSERRANNVAKALAGLGVPPNQMAVSGRGENDNRVPTADGVREPQNRRVEIGWP